MTIQNIFSCTDVQLKDTLNEELAELGYTATNTKDFLYAEGDAPYMLVAHLDTVHQKSPSIICYSDDRNYIMSPYGIGGDDRCGVYIILSLLNRLPFKPYLLFTMGEEKGGLGARAYIDYMCEQEDIPELKYIVEYDRKGNKDCVFYQCDNKDFTEFVEGFGFKTAHGSFTDISVIAPEFGVAAVNLSSGYYNPHTQHEVVCVSDMENVIDASLKMLCTECEQFEYIEKVVPKYTYPSKQGGSTKYNGGYREVTITFLEPQTVEIYSYMLRGYYANAKEEVAIDEKGNYYRYFPDYGDYERLYYAKPIDPAKPPKFDENNTATIFVYSYT